MLECDKDEAELRRFGGRRAICGADIGETSVPVTALPQERPEGHLSTPQHLNRSPLSC